MKITPEIIQEVTDRLVKTYKPLEIYLFGSYAWGRPTKESDLDLLVVVEKSKEKSYQRSRVGDFALCDIRVGWDLLVYTKNEFDAWANHVSTLCYKIKKDGRRLYAKKKKSGITKAR